MLCQVCTKQQDLQTCNGSCEQLRGSQQCKGLLCHILHLILSACLQATELTLTSLVARAAAKAYDAAIYVKARRYLANSNGAAWTCIPWLGADAKLASWSCLN